jgi:Flp pilus assembly pilin Flp
MRKQRQKAYGESGIGSALCPLPFNSASDDTKQPARSGLMQRVMVAINSLVRTEDGQDLIEYAMLVVLIAVGAVIAVQRVGDTINAVLWQAIASSSY